MELNQLIAGRINWSQSCFLGNEATASLYMAYAIPPAIRTMVALYRRASAIPLFRYTGIPLSSWNSFCFFGTLFSNCLPEAVLMVLLVIWWRARKFCSILAQLLLTNHDDWPLGTHASDLEATAQWCSLLIKKNFFLQRFFSYMNIDACLHTFIIYFSFFVYFLIQIFSNVFLCLTFITYTFKAHFICCKKGDRPCTAHVALYNIRIDFCISLLTPLYWKYHPVMTSYIYNHISLQHNDFISS